MDSIYTAWITKRLPPRQQGASSTVRVVACNATTTAFELDNDLFQVAPAGSAVGTPGSYGPARLFVQNDGANNLYVLFGPNNSVAANSAASNAATGQTCVCVFPNTISEPFYVEPAIDKFVSLRTPNGSANTTTARLYVLSEPLSWKPGGG